MRTSKRSAFTIVELMIIVVILCDLCLIALPAFIRSRNMAQNSRFMSDLRTASGDFEMYAAENNSYPPPAQPGVIPSGMLNYLKEFPWSDYNSIGGQWVWPGPYQSTTASLQITFPFSIDPLRMTDIDVRMDDGILATGAFREADANDLYYILEP